MRDSQLLDDRVKLLKQKVAAADQTGFLGLILAAAMIAVPCAMKMKGPVTLIPFALAIPTAGLTMYVQSVESKTREKLALAVAAQKEIKGTAIANEIHGEAGEETLLADFDKVLLMCSDPQDRSDARWLKTVYGLSFAYEYVIDGLRAEGQPIKAIQDSHTELDEADQSELLIQLLRRRLGLSNGTLAQLWDMTPYDNQVVYRRRLMFNLATPKTALAVMPVELPVAVNAGVAAPEDDQSELLRALRKRRNQLDL